MKSRSGAKVSRQWIDAGLVRLAIASFLVSTFSIASSAQAPALVGAARFADSAAREINRGAIEGDINQLHAARTLLDAALALHPNDPLLLHYKGFEAYREASLMYAGNRQSEIAGLMRQAATDLARSDSIKTMPENHALLASVLGSMIGADPKPTHGSARCFRRKGNRQTRLLLTTGRWRSNQSTHGSSTYWCHR